MAIRLRSRFSKYGGVGSALEGISSSLFGSYASPIQRSGLVHSQLSELEGRFIGLTQVGSGVFGTLAAVFTDLTGTLSGGIHAPEFIVAPQSVSLPAAGGVIQFTAVGSATLTYSLPQTRAGITINVSSGLVTVSGVAQGTSGDIIVRASDGTFFTDVQCLVTVAVYVPAGNWQLQGEFYEPGVLPAYLIYPRPSAETAWYARYKWAYYDGVNVMQYRMPIGVAGMGYPLKYEVLDGPPGMTVGAQYGAPNYGIVTWIPSGPEIDRYCRVRVYSQDYGRAGTLPFSGLPADEYFDVEWTVSTSQEMFLFVDEASGNDLTGTGSWMSPYKNWGWYKGNASVGVDPIDPIHAGKIVVFKNGNYIADGNQWPGDGRDKITWLKSSVTPFSLIAFPGHSPFIDMSLESFFGTVADPRWWVDPAANDTFAYRSPCINFDGTDFSVVGISFRGSPTVRGDGQAINNSEMFTAVASTRPHRMLWFENDFRGNHAGYDSPEYKAFLVEYNAAHGSGIRVGNDNTSCMWLSNPGVQPTGRLFHMCVVNNHWEDSVEDDATNWTHLNFSHTERALVQGNVGLNSNADGVWQKGWAKYWCVRDNDYWNQSGTVISCTLSRDYENTVSTNVSGGHEYWYNRAGNTGLTFGSSAIDALIYPDVWPSGTAYEPVFCIRCSARGIGTNTLKGFSRIARYPLYVSNCVFLFQKISADHLVKLAEYPNSINIVSSTDSVFDSNTGNLTGSYAQYAGKKGAQIVYP